jgi:energy-coupling factor transporter ATP-binding protein EcfA2
MDVVLIVGGDNSGKSTLVRCLTGLGRGSNKHPSDRNETVLNWGTPTVSLKTFCLISSLNEGIFYLGSRISSNSALPFGRENTIEPSDLTPILDAYSLRGCSKAILCISTSVSRVGWRLADYSSLVAGGMIGQHRVSAVLGLGVANPNFGAGAFIALPSAPHPRNAVAALARQSISIQ